MKNNKRRKKRLNPPRATARYLKADMIFIF